MLRTVLLAAAITATGFSAPAMAQSASAPSVDPAIGSCLRANVARVSAQAASLMDAAEFLLNNVCAVEVASAYGRAQQVRFERMRARFCQNGAPTAAALQGDPGDDEDTAAYVRAYCEEGGAWSNQDIEESVTVMSSVTVATPADRALAAQLILDARSQR
jgi:hypothetical protein